MKINLLLTFLILFVSKSFAQLNCYNAENGLHQYYAKLDLLSSMDTNFNKADFISYLSNYGNLSNENATFLEAELIKSIKAFVGTQSELLKNVAYIESSADIYPILSNSNNSISIIECSGNAELLNTQNLAINKNKISVTKNPVDANSAVIIDPKIKNFNFIIRNSLGQIIYNKQYNNITTLKFGNYIKESGIYFIQILDLDQKDSTTIKVIK